MNGRFWKYALILVGLIVVSIGCSSETSSTEPTPTVDQAVAMQAAIQATMAAEQDNRGEQIAAWLTELEAAEVRWEANPVSNYEIEVLYVESTRQIIQFHTITVANGIVVAEERRCRDQFLNCIFAEIAAERFTIPGLFQTARAALENDEVNDAGGGFDFHETYGFPQRIALHSPGANSLPWYWQVESFTVTE